MIDLQGLWPHQVETYNFTVGKEQTFCTSSPGTGKSLPHAKLAEHFIKHEGGSKVLVVCPKTLMRTTWSHEFAKFTPSLSIGIAEAPESNRVKVFEAQHDVVVLNIDGVTWLKDQPEKWLKKVLGSKSMLIIDESDNYKNPNAKRTKAMIKLSKYFHRRHLLAGTPAPNSIIELWPQLFILDEGARLGKRYTAFRNTMQYPINKGPFVTWIDKPDASKVTYAMISDLVIHHEFDEVMTQVPAMQHQVLYYELPKKHKKFYDDMEKQEYLEHKGKSISAVNAGSLANKLLQIASGAVYNDERTWSTLDSGRYELIADLVEQRKHSIVFFQWRHQRQELEKEYQKRGLKYAVIDGSIKSTKERAESIERFEAGELDTFLLQPLSAGHGVTLIKADTAIFASPVYQGNMFKQCIARIRRGLQRQHTQTITILGKGTRDEHCYEVFSGKVSKIEALNELFWKGFENV